MGSSRLSFAEGVCLLKEAPLEELQAAAREERTKHTDPAYVTFVTDANPNYTNICNADCSFCGFYRHVGAKDGYKKTVEETLEHIAWAERAGLSTVLLQGGLTDYPLDFYLTVVRETRRRHPSIYPHFWTAPEIWNCAKVNGLTPKECLKELYAAGQRTLPGGGAEILSERVRLKVSPKKMEPGGWIAVHKAAHEVGMRSTATMMYGHVEEIEDLVTHLDAIRTLQDETGGFTAFIPWSYKRSRTALRRLVKHWAGADAYYRILAFARLYLDNFAHIQASWFSEGVETGIEALRLCGADDFGGTVMEENVHRATGFVNRANLNDLLRWIREAGFEPLERNPLYEIIRRFEGVERVDLPPEQEIQESNQLAILQESPPCS